MTAAPGNKSFGGIVVPALIGLAAFLLITGGSILNPLNTGWLAAGDPAQHYLGWLFFRSSPMLQQPLGLNSRIGCSRRATGRGYWLD